MSVNISGNASFCCMILFMIKKFRQEICLFSATVVILNRLAEYSFTLENM